MAQATLTSPLTLDPQTAAKLVIKRATLDFQDRTVVIHYDMLDSNGRVIERRSTIASGAQVQTYITNQESTIYTRLLAQLNVTGTVA
jgi:hypothetical protein